MARLEIRPTWRTALSFLASWAVGLAYVGLAVESGADVNVMAALYVLAFFIAPILNLHASLAARLIARAFWFQSALLYSLTGGYALYKFHTGSATLETLEMSWAVVAVATIWAGPIVALAAVGRSGLDATTSYFKPTKFRGAMLASLLFGAADLMALLMYATIHMYDSVRNWPEAAALTSCAVLMGCALFGLFRLKLWGLVVCVGANILVAWLAVAGTLDLPDLLAGGLVATALIQLLIPIPIVREIARSLRSKRLPA